MANGIIVDDSKFMRRIIRQALESGGHTVVAEAENGALGIKLYKKEKPDFVTIDITMQVLDGLKTISEIRSLDPDARIIIISALSEKTLRLLQEEIDADAFITKPFDTDDLLNTLQKLL